MIVPVLITGSIVGCGAIGGGKLFLKLYSIKLNLRIFGCVKASGLKNRIEGHIA